MTNTNTTLCPVAAQRRRPDQRRPGQALAQVRPARRRRDHRAGPARRDLLRSEPGVLRERRQPADGPGPGLDPAHPRRRRDARDPARLHRPVGRGPDERLRRRLRPARRPTAAPTTDLGLWAIVDRRRPRRPAGARQRPGPHAAEGPFLHRHPRAWASSGFGIATAALRHRAAALPRRRRHQDVADREVPRPDALLLARCRRRRAGRRRQQVHPARAATPTRSATTSRSPGTTASRWLGTRSRSSPSPVRAAASPASSPTMQLGSAPARIGIGMLFLTIAAVVIGGTSLGGRRGRRPAHRQSASSC